MRETFHKRQYTSRIIISWWIMDVCWLLSLVALFGCTLHFVLATSHTGLTRSTTNIFRQPAVSSTPTTTRTLIVAGERRPFLKDKHFILRSRPPLYLASSSGALSTAQDEVEDTIDDDVVALLSNDENDANSFVNDEKFVPMRLDVPAMRNRIVKRIHEHKSLALWGWAALFLKLVTSQAVRRAVYFWWHAGPMIVHYKWTQFWLNQVVATNDSKKRDALYERLHKRYADPALRIILHLKGLYCKIGQVLSTRPDFIPYTYIVRFSTVQDSIPQWPVERIHAIVKESWQKYLELDVDDVFEYIDPVALGSASIGQVHCATLTDAWAEKLELYKANPNKHVAIKVMHPDAKKLFAHDFQVFKWLCRLVLPGWFGFLDELERRILQEFDYEREARDMDEIRDNLKASPYKDMCVVPKAEHDLCCPNILCMELLENGTKLADAIQQGLVRVFNGDEEKARAFLRLQQQEVMFGQQPPTQHGEKFSHYLRGFGNFGMMTLVRMNVLQRKYIRFVRILLGVHGYQIFVNGCYNGDPHPGNCLELGNGGCLGLIDFGQVRRLTDRDRLAAARVVFALARDESQAVIAQCMREYGFQTRKTTDNDAILVEYAQLFMDCDYRCGFATPQLWFADMMAQNPLVEIPESSIFIARTSFLFRGMGKGLRMPPVRTALYWKEYAEMAIQELESKEMKDEEDMPED